MLPINRKISAYNHYNYNKVRFIVLHYVGQVSTAKNNADYFAGGNHDASAHYFVDDNSIWQSVEDFHGAWHVGNTRTEVNNWNSIGIEMCCQNDGHLTISAKTEQNALELTKYLMTKYSVGIDNIRTHYEVTAGNKVCPNWDADNWQRWRNFKAKLLGQSVSAPAPAPGTSTISEGKVYSYRDCVKIWQKAMNVGFDLYGSAALDVDGYFGPASEYVASHHPMYQGIKGCPTAVKWLQQRIGVTVDGDFGPTTKKVVANYQSKNGLPASGTVDLKTYKSLLGLEDYRKKVTLPNVYYRVNAGGRWLPEVKNLEDYAGIPGHDITDVAMRVDKGTIKYRVHTVSGAWLGWISKCDIHDAIYGYAGNGTPIDAIQVVYSTPKDVVEAFGYRYAKYRVAPESRDYYSWQLDDMQKKGMDGYAGCFGKSIDKFQITLE